MRFTNRLPPDSATTGGPLVDALADMTRAAEAALKHWGFTPEAARAGLAQVPAAAEAVLWLELTLIASARIAGIGWKEIAEGIHPASRSPKQYANSRYRLLADRFPDHPLVAHLNTLKSRP